MILADKLESEEIFAGEAFLGVLLEDGSHEIFELLRNFLVGREFNLIGYLRKLDITIFLRSSCSLILNGDAPKTSS